MKKITIPAIVLASVILFGCTPIPTDYETASTEATSDSSISLADDQFEFNGKTVSVLDDVPYIFEVLGTPYKKEAFPEPHQDRVDYYYGSDDKYVALNTGNIDGKDCPFYIIICDNNIKTSKGIGLGSTEDEVRAAYGEPTDSWEEGNHSISYDFERFELVFSFLDEVCSFEYRNKDVISKYLAFLSTIDQANFDSYLEDYEFNYNGEAISIFDKVQDTQSKLGTPYKIDNYAQSGNFAYYYGTESDFIQYNTISVNDSELPRFILIKDRNVRTPGGISVGSTRDEVIDAYNIRTQVFYETFHSISYKFNDYEITFHFDDSDSFVESICYTNIKSHKES